jgi:WD40 repeat protein
MVMLIAPDSRSPVEQLAISPAGDTLYQGHRDGWVTAWNLFTGSNAGNWPAFGDAISGLAVSQDGRVLATSRSDERLQVSDLQLRKSYGEFDLRVGYIQACSLSSVDQGLLVIGQPERLQHMPLGTHAALNRD